MSIGLTHNLYIHIFIAALVTCKNERDYVLKDKLVAYMAKLVL